MLAEESTPLLQSQYRTVSVLTINMLIIYFAYLLSLTYPSPCLTSSHKMTVDMPKSSVANMVAYKTYRCILYADIPYAFYGIGATEHVVRLISPKLKPSLPCPHKPFIAPMATGHKRPYHKLHTPGGRLGSNYARMCVSKSEGHGSFFWLQGSEMSQNISLNRGLKFAASLNMGKNLCRVLYI